MLAFFGKRAGYSGSREVVLQAEGVADASGAVATPTAHILLRLDFGLWAWKRVRRKVAAS